MTPECDAAGCLCSLFRLFLYKLYISEPAGSYPNTIQINHLDRMVTIFASASYDDPEPRQISRNWQAKLITYLGLLSRDSKSTVNVPRTFLPNSINSTYIDISATILQHLQEAT